MSFNGIYKGKKILLTGHTGFKGSWMAIWLKELGADVYGYALEPTSEKENFVTTGLATKINHTIGDVRDLEKLKAYFRQVQPDIAFHFAAQPLVLFSYLDPVNTFSTNLMGTVNFFEAVRSTPAVKAAVNITSDKCYDNKEWLQGYRETDPMGGKDPYSASKGAAELITASYQHSFFKDSLCNIASGRAGNVIGGGDWAENRIVPDFFRSVLAGNKMMLRNPHATRPWQHVLEPLSGYLALGEALLSKEGKKYAGGWNFGPADSANHSVEFLIQKLVAFNGTGEYEQQQATEKPHEAHFLKLDISKAAEGLHWQPVLDLEQMIRFTVEGYDETIAGSAYEKRMGQIKEYTSLARDKNISWAFV